MRVLVPFGGRRMIGVVTGAAGDDGGREIKEVAQVLDESPLVLPPLLDLAAWMAEHYLAPPGECYRMVLPPAGVRASRAVARLVKPGEGGGDDPVVRLLEAGPLRLSALEKRLGGDPQARVARLRRAGIVAVEQEIGAPGFREVRVAVLGDAPFEPKGRAQAEVLERLRAAGGRARVADLVRDRPSRRGTIERLAERGALTLSPSGRCAGRSGSRTAHRCPSRPPRSRRRRSSPARGGRGRVVSPVPPPRRHRDRQDRGVPARDRGGAVARPGRDRAGAGDLPHPAARPGGPGALRPTRVGPPQRLAAAERHDQWWRIREGGARVVVGARSAVFAPVPEPRARGRGRGARHSYKQDESPRYHGRDMAVMRARLEGCPAVLGSATPSLESHGTRCAASTRLPSPSASDPGPSAGRVVDQRAVLRRAATPSCSRCARRSPSARPPESRPRPAEPARVRPSLLCRECGQEASAPTAGCRSPCTRGAAPPCATTAAASRHPPPARRATGPPPPSGFGTERVEEAVEAVLPGARVERLDRDALAGAASLPRPWPLEKGEIDVLVGTQMIAKGHDFPSVTLVGVVDADMGLGMPDFRSAERTFQLLTQVAGRAGRGETAGGSCCRATCRAATRPAPAPRTTTRSSSANSSSGGRWATPRCAALVNVIVRAADPAKGSAEAEALAGVAARGGGGKYRVLGAAYAPLGACATGTLPGAAEGAPPGHARRVQAALVKRYGPQRWPGRRGRRSPDRNVTPHRSQPVDSERLEEVVPVEADRVGDEGDRGGRESDEPHPGAGAADRRLVVEGRRVAAAEDADKDGPRDQLGPK